MKRLLIIISMAVSSMLVANTGIKPPEETPTPVPYEEIGEPPLLYDVITDPTFVQNDPPLPSGTPEAPGYPPAPSELHDYPMPATSTPTDYPRPITKTVTP